MRNIIIIHGYLFRLWIICCFDVNDSTIILEQRFLIKWIVKLYLGYGRYIIMFKNSLSVSIM